MIVGVISDTHGLLRPQAVRALRGSQLIIHAGDIGPREILEELAAIAPVHAVRGNVDKGAWARALPLTNVVDAAGTQLYVLHNLKQLDVSPAPRLRGRHQRAFPPAGAGVARWGALLQSGQRRTAPFPPAGNRGKAAYCERESAGGDCHSERIGSKNVAVAVVGSWLQITNVVVPLRDLLVGVR
jgi:hypothetical protein